MLRAPHHSVLHRRLLLEVARATASHRDLPSLLRDLARVLHRAVGFDRLALVLHDAERDVMHVHSLAGLEPAPTLVVDLPPAQTPAGIAWQTQQPVVLSGHDGNARFPLVMGGAETHDAPVAHAEARHRPPHRLADDRRADMSARRRHVGGVSTAFRPIFASGGRRASGTAIALA